MDHYNNPRNVGSLKITECDENGNINSNIVASGLVGAPACGDVMRLQMEVDENNNIIDAKFKTFGCGSAVASSSLLTEMVKGSTIDEAQKITNKAIAKALSLPPIKLHCSTLAEEAIKAALKDLQEQRTKRQIAVASKNHVSINS